MRQLEKHISQFTKELFPSFYKEEGTLFIKFVQAYYEWLEQNNQVLYEARRLPDNRDIDRTLEEFIIHFKEKYLPNIQFTTASNKRLFVKNSLDFYRSKGTKRSVELFFQLVHGIEADVYYPGDDLFNTSDNEWIRTQYLEIPISSTNINLVGTTIEGTVSGAEAFVERLVRLRPKGKFIDVLYITALDGDFQTGENVRTKNTNKNGTPKIIGSTEEITIKSSFGGFSVGEECYVIDGAGSRGKAVVTETKLSDGIINYTINESRGFGYQLTGSFKTAAVLAANSSANTDSFKNQTTTKPLISERVLVCDDWNIPSPINPDVSTEYWHERKPFEILTFVKENLALITHPGQNVNTNVGDTARLEYNSNTIFQGKILRVQYNVADDETKIHVNFNNYPNTTFTANTEDLEEVDTLYVDGVIVFQQNTSANLTATDVSAIGKVVGFSNSAVFQYSANSALPDTQIEVSDSIYQKIRNREFANAQVVSSYTVGTGIIQYFIGLNNINGNFRSDMPFYLRSSDETFNIENISDYRFGVSNVQNEFISGGLIYGYNYNIVDGGTELRDNKSSATLTSLGVGSGAIINISKLLETPETDETVNLLYTVRAVPDIVGDFLDVDIANTAYGFSGSAILGWDESQNTSPGSNSTIEDFFDWYSVEVGPVDEFVFSGLGSNYTEDPFILIHDEVFEPQSRWDYIMKYDNEDNVFEVGEILTHSNNLISQAYGKIIGAEASTKTLYVTNLSPDKKFVAKKEIITLENRNKATLVSFEPWLYDDFDHQSGINADISGEAENTQGAIKTVQISASGFGYEDGDAITLVSSQNSDRTASGLISLGKQGIGEGYFTNRRGFLSSDKYLYDGHFYQEYSYQVLTALPFEEYKDVLQNVLHVAGTKMFGAYKSTEVVNTPITGSGELETE
jgi:hypothetical protein